MTVRAPTVFARRSDPCERPSSFVGHHVAILSHHGQDLADERAKLCQREMVRRPGARPLGWVPSFLPRSHGCERGMATIRDKMGHCLHEFFTMRRSRAQAAIQNEGGACTPVPRSFGPGSACTCRTG